MQRIQKSRVLILALSILAGCSIRHDYVWNEYPITPERIPAQNSFVGGREIAIIKGTSNSAIVLLGEIGKHKYYGSEQSLTNAVADQLASEMRNRGLETNRSTARKSLEITTTHAYFEPGMWKIAALVQFTVKFGNGKNKSYAVRNSTPGAVDRAYDGAVALAVIEILKDPDVRAYINE